MPTDRKSYQSQLGQTPGTDHRSRLTAESVGNIYVQGHEDEMLVQEFSHNVTVPTDPQSGQPLRPAFAQTVYLHRGCEQSGSAAVQRAGLQ